LWQDAFGNVEFAIDCFGTWICKFDYADYDVERVRPGGNRKPHKYGWDVDHIRPISNFINETDADFNNNYEPMHRQNNLTKGDDYPYIKISENKYKVVVCDICKGHQQKGYGIVDESTGNRIDWKFRTNKYYHD